MMTLITGVPGSGKTALCVEKLLLPIAGKPEKAIDSDGNSVEIVRKIWTNINGLLIEHEKIDESHLNTWHQWAKPGDLIVYDEVQKPWPLKATGSAKPPYIEALETHRHMGVDFIFMTQHPMLVDASIARLGGRHLHVRRLGNSRFATVYEWDGVSRTLLYKNSMAKTPWRRSPKTEKAYRSAALHTKQPRKMPALLWGIGFAACLLAYLGPTVAQRMSERISPSPVVHKPLPPVAAPLAAASAAGPRVPASAPDWVREKRASYAASLSVEKVVQPAGCIAMRGICRCTDEAGKDVAPHVEMCAAVMGDRLAAVIPDSLQEHQGPVKAPGWAGWANKLPEKGMTAQDIVAKFHNPNAP